MRYLTKLLPSLSLLLIATCLLAARATAQEAKVLKIIGTGATVSQPGGAPATLTEGMGVAKGATINSGGADVYLEPVTGAIAVIKKNSQVLVEELSGNNPILDLKSGDLVSQLDSRLAGKTYGVRTPRGVAAARGTTYTVKVSGVEYTVMSQNGTVTITPSGPNPGPAITLSAGGVSMSNVNNGAVLTQTEMTANSAAIAEAASIAVSAIAVVAANTSSTFSDASVAAAGNELTATLQTVVKVIPGDIAQVVGAASAAAPTQADEMVTAVIAQSNASGRNVSADANTVTQAAAQGAASTATSGQNAMATTRAIAQAASAAVVATGMTGPQLQTVSQSLVNAAATGGVQGAAQAGLTGPNVVNQISVGASTGVTQGTQGAVTIAPPNVTITDAPASVVTPINPDSVNVVSPN